MKNEMVVSFAFTYCIRKCLLNYTSYIYARNQISLKHPSPISNLYVGFVRSPLESRSMRISKRKVVYTHLDNAATGRMTSNKLQTKELWMLKKL